MLKLLNEFLSVETSWYFQDELPEKRKSEDAQLTRYIDKLHSIIKEQRKALKTLCKRIKKFQVTSTFDEQSTLYRLKLIGGCSYHITEKVLG